MQVILLTIFFSLILAAVFVVLFIGERGKGGMRSAEQDALLPFHKEKGSLSSEKKPDKE